MAPTYPNLDLVGGDLSRIRNLQPVCRTGMQRHDNQVHAVPAVRMAVMCPRGARHDAWVVNTNYESDEEQRVSQM